MSALGWFTCRRLLVRLLVLAAILWVGSTARAADPEAETSVYAFSAKRLGGAPQPLSDFRGQVLLIVNTASYCGYTRQFDGLQAIYERYRVRGFQVLGFPSNDFGGQEPGTDAQIGSFCRSNYGVEFPMFSKVSVQGDAAHPLYRYLTSRPAPVGGPIDWNFQKYLVDRDGTVVARYRPAREPEDPALARDIERLLESDSTAVSRR